jgi:hypothetical protein
MFTAVVNKPESVNIEGAFEAEALRVLRATPGLTVIAEPGGADRRADAILRFAGNHAHVAVEFKRHANAATAWQLVHHTHDRPGMPLLLIAGQTTAEARAILEDHSIAVIDGLGNAHIELPGLLFHLEGRRRLTRSSAATSSPTRLSGKAGVVAQALLLHPERVWKVRDLAGETEVSAGLAHRVLARLQGEGVMAAQGAGPNRVRRVTNPTALLDLWAEENVDRPSRTRAYLLAQTPQQLITALGANLGRSGIDYAITGAAAGSLLAPSVTAVPVVELWARATVVPEELCDAAQADRVNEGQNVVFLQGKDDIPLAFREETKGVWVANRFRVYADLRRDPRRGREQADHLRQEVIGF